MKNIHRASLLCLGVCAVIKRSFAGREKNENIITARILVLRRGLVRANRVYVVCCASPRGRTFLSELFISVDGQTGADAFLLPHCGLQCLQSMLMLTAPDWDVSELGAGEVGGGHGIICKQLLNKQQLTDR